MSCFSKNLVTLTATLLIAGGAVSEEIVGKPSTLADGLQDIAKPLIRHSTFRKSIAEVHLDLVGHCRLTSAVKGEGEAVNNYACNPASGIYKARVNTRESRICGKFLVGLRIEFDMRLFAAIEDQAFRNLGKGTLAESTLREWRYTSDKQLSKCGDPLVMLSKDDDGHGRLEFGHEVGP